MSDQWTADDLVNVIPTEIAVMVDILCAGRNGSAWLDLVYLAAIGRQSLDAEFDATVPRD